MRPGWGSKSWSQYMTEKESAKLPTALVPRTHDPSTTDKKSPAPPTPLLGPAETNTHISIL